jgi:negative regulator of flagellin synthesis FlgM
MRIDAYNKVTQAYKINNTRKTTKSASTTQTDRYEISQTAKDYQTARMAVKSSDDVRMDLVNDIKKRMDAGTYNVSDSDFADKLIAKFIG